MPPIIPSLNHISLSLSYSTAVPRVSKEPLSPLDGDSWDRDVLDARSAPLAQGTEPTGGWKPLCFRSSHRTHSLTCADFVDVHVEPQHGRAQHEGHPRPDDRHGEQDSCAGTRAGKGSAWGKGPRGQRGLRVGPGSAVPASSTAHFPDSFLISKSHSPTLPIFPSHTEFPLARLRPFLTLVCSLLEGLQ